ncbi:MAG: hypothetical protein WA672_09840 [Candidatus Angelobacter sp.]
MSIDANRIDRDGDLPSIADVLHDPAASFWLKAALRTALERDPVDVTNDAEILLRLMEARLRALLKQPQT